MGENADGALVTRECASVRPASPVAVDVRARARSGFLATSHRMWLHRSNRVEALADALAGVVAEPLRDALEPECIVVQSRAMATWISMRLAQDHGVWAGGEFPFPRRFVDRVFRAVLPDATDGLENFCAPRLLWSILAELPAHLEHGAFKELARFVADDPRGTARFSLSQRIAAVFDQYLVFRPEMLLSWERGEEENWQARLWRALVERLGPRHLPGLARDFFDALEHGRFDPTSLPSRVSVFGLSTLPPFFVRIVAALGQRIPLHLFVVSPSSAWWADVRSHREALRDAAHRGEVAPDPAAVVAPGAPNLLASLGQVARDFQGILESAAEYEEPRDDLYVAPPEDRLLGILQSDMLALRSRTDPPRVRDDDRSIEVHACHSPMREVEVLHDRLLGLLADDPTLQPRDILVMMSDVPTYAPLVEAVFERDPTEGTALPYCLADRSVRAQSPVIEAFHRILDLVGGRMTASEVVDLLALEPLQRRFGYSAQDVDTMTTWISEAGIRWGIDAPHRKRHGQPKLASNTWRFGLDRLVLGVALPTRGRQTYAGVLPYDEIEGQQTALLGQLVQLCTRLFEITLGLEEPRPLREWQGALHEVLDALLVGPSESDAAAALIRGALEDVASEAETAGFDEPVSLDAVRALIDERIEEDAPARGFLAGGVTLCAMLPMRSVPFRVIALLGMGDTAFPRSSTCIGFDLIAAAPRHGDRSRRTDDRYLFLEALLAARERLLVFHVGQSIVDNSPIPPSVVVSELVDELGRMAVAPGSTQIDPEAMRRHLVVRHPMQPFSPRYFGGGVGADHDPRLFSFESVYCEGAKVLAAGAATQLHAPLLAQPLPAPDGDRELALAQLVRFFRLPAAELLKRRLGVHLDDWSRDRSDREPMELDPLEEWHLGQALLRHELEDLDPETSLLLLRASGALPLGTPGDVRYEDLRRIVDPIRSAAKAWCGPEPLPPLDVDLQVGNTRVTGSIGGRWPRAVALPQYAKLGAKHLLGSWIRHVALCAAAPTDQEPKSVVIARADKGSAARVAVFRPVQDARARLRDLVELYFIGQREPLLLFPKSSLAFTQTFAATGDLEAALREAHRPWTERFGGERDEPHLQRLFGDADVFAPDYAPLGRTPTAGNFATIAVRVFEPMLAHMREES